MANKDNSDAMQRGTDPRSNPGPDTKEKSESNSEPKEKQKGPSGDSSQENAPKIEDDTPSSSQTVGHPQSDKETKRQVERDNNSKAEGIKEGPSDESSPDNARKKEDGPSGDSLPENDPEKEDEPAKNIPSSSETKGHPHSDTQTKKQVDTDNDNIAESIKEGTSDEASPDNSPKKEDEPAKNFPSSSETKGHPHSDTQTKKQVDTENDNVAESVKEESPLNNQKPEEEEEEDETKRNINEVDGVTDENENQDQGQNLQPQIAVPRSNQTPWICAAGVILLAIVCALVCSPDSTPPVPHELNVVDIFNQEMKKLESSFPNQHPELWRRSLIHLRRHLKTKNPTEPVSLILTSGHRAENTLGCLAKCLAQAFSTALNSSVLHINGKDKASQDSDQVKLDIDSELRKAFEGKKSAAVVHRFEELPPGSTLIFYRYCDHENAAYKEVFLAFTVMLDSEVEVPSNVNLGRVEEMVQEHIKQKFVSSDKSAMFNQMDIDKLSGLWSRISHLILPVAAEEKIEQQGCVECNK